MLFAIVNGEKVEASPQTTGVCPACQKTVFSRCGKIKIWHWAHYKSDECDNWYERETEWHKNWKFAFGKENCEVIIIKEGVRHIADVQTTAGVVIEFQHSPIATEVIFTRENFYGERMIWILDGRHFKDKFSVFSRSPALDADDEYDRRFNPLSPNYGKDVDASKKGTLNFIWNWSWQSWIEVERTVFIDLGGDSLFRVEAGMGMSRGIGTWIQKSEFLKEHGGNLDHLSSLIENEIINPMP